jgi:hypothetical protein
VRARKQLHAADLCTINASCVLPHTLAYTVLERFSTQAPDDVFIMLVCLDVSFNRAGKYESCLLYAAVYLAVQGVG